MREVTDFLQANDVYFLLALSILSIILMVWCIITSVKLSKLSRRRGAKLEEGRVGDIVDSLTNQSVSLETMQAQLDELRATQSEQSGMLSRCLKNVGIVRFNAFDDIGGEQSFSVVVMDSDRNGVAVSSLYGRQDSRVYAKSIINGQGERPLSTEELQALNMALK